MNDNQLIMMIILSYLIIYFTIHMIFFLTTIFYNRWKFINITKKFFHRYFKQIHTKNHNLLEQSQNDRKMTSSNIILESEIVLIRTIRSYGLFFCTVLFITNWLRLIIYLLPKFYPNIIEYRSNICIIQSFSLHILTLFHLNLTICIRFFWHYCSIFSKYWQTITYRRLWILFLCFFTYLSIFTWPSIGDEWGSIIYDHILNICIVNYRFNLSYTFFILSFSCLIPVILLIFSHYGQMKCLDRRMIEYFSTFKIEDPKQKSHIIHQKNQFELCSYLIFIWVIFNIILLISIHIPLNNRELIKSVLYYIQMLTFLLDPILYIFIFRCLSIITFLKPTTEIYV